ncbi:diaminopimelate epimerase [Anaerosporomusa subterranea]|uniref:Diaminopimelate epimerase n=1 Tax=Anaerosporomusa subterranea TaxID=1794912 RepID=A0A154BTS1_ANASB|nr:diaminopimelate epimerase [Anaerosporomusa subterranea]KYZ77220.1 diaminopimelate epimerase [Anaerosporomusa subterranea]
MKFSKWHGLGNDFIFVNGFEKAPINLQQLAETLCDRHFGIGADGLVLVLPSTQADFRMQIFNSDGSEAQMCGNATRCFSRYVHTNGLTKKNELTIETLAGIIHARLVGDGSEVKVNLGEPKLKRSEIPVSGDSASTAINVPITINDITYNATCVSTGVPHCVIFVDSFQGLDWQNIGKKIEIHPLFPEKTNVEFIQVINRSEMIMKVWERGAGVTLACGTGASASLVAGVLTNKTDRKAVVHLEGGDLQIEWEEATGHVLMTGPAVESFVGDISIENSVATD